MLRKILPVVLALTGLAAGMGAGVLLRSDPAEEVSAEQPQPGPLDLRGPVTHEPREYVKLNSQFIVPVVNAGRVAALVILTISIEVKPGGTENVFSREPRLRDAILQVLFDHANTGGFQGTFTEGANMIVLRTALREVAQRVLGETATDVLIVDIVRQDN